MKRFLLASAGVVALALSACTDQAGSTKSLSPIPPKTMARMAEKGMSKGDPILVRVYKKESELEVWKKVDGHYAHLKTFPICRWSGQLGPKVREGDRQAPEGFYSISPAQMNPNSAYYLSFNTGYPNAFDRTHNRTGAHLMVHGTCSSAGCYAMTDEGISEVYAIAREAFSGGQKAFQFQAYPFRMTAENLAKYRQDPNMAFWKNLKQGSDHFEITKREPKVSVCAGRYAFDTVGESCKDDPTLAATVAQKDDEDRRQVADLVAKGVPAVRAVYADGSGHESFRSTSVPAPGDSGSALALLESKPRPNLGEVSRPDALRDGPREIAVAEPAAKPSARGSATLARMALADAARERNTPKAGRAGRTVLASADPDAPVTTASTLSEADKPLYARMMSGVFGGADTPSRPETSSAASASVPGDGGGARAVPAGPARSASTRATTEPRPAGEGKPVADKAAPIRPKPRVEADLASKHVSGGKILPGAHAVGPSASGFRTN